ncbi:MAG: hypothetical protein PVI43_00930 [Candidatus Bathyarchaeota archaeon]|jgi:hypothetical protein
MKKQSSYSRMKESVGMRDYIKGKEAGWRLAGMEHYQKHPEGKSKKDYPLEGAHK